MFVLHFFYLIISVIQSICKYYFHTCYMQVADNTDITEILPNILWYGGESKTNVLRVLDWVSTPGDLPNPGIESSLPHCRQMIYPLSHQGSF